MSAPDIDETDVEAVAEVLRSGRLALGPRAEELEHRIAEYAGVPHAVAVSSGTAALHLILKGLGCGPGTRSWCPRSPLPRASNAILYVGASPVFADIEPEQYTLDPEDAARRVTGRTRAIMAVDIFGHPVEWDALSARGPAARAHELVHVCGAPRGGCGPHRVVLAMETQGVPARAYFPPMHLQPYEC